MKFRKVLSLLALLFNLDTILAGCTMEEEENKWNIIHWISRIIKLYVNLYFFDSKKFIDFDFDSTGDHQRDFIFPGGV